MKIPMSNKQLIGKVEDFKEKEAYGIDLESISILVVNQKGRLYVYENRCPHRGIRLEWQPNQFLDYEKQFIQCAMHGALFRIEDGECIAGPCPGEMLSALPFQIEEGLLFLINTNAELTD